MTRGKTNTVLKAGIWYAIGNFFLKGIAFLTTPIFSRILSKTDYGTYSNFMSWEAILIVPCSLMLIATIYTARFDFEKKINSYLSTIVLLGIISTLFFGGFCTMFSTEFEAISLLNSKCILMLFIYILFSTPIEIFLMWQRIQYKYKLSVFISICVSVTSTILSIILVLNCENRLAGRIVGFVMPTVVFGVIIIICLFRKSFDIKLTYAKYALRYAIPYIPHTLGMTILSSTDRIMISKFCGIEDTAMYSIAYSSAMVLSILNGAIFSAYNPWFSEKLRKRDSTATRRMTIPLMGVYGIPMLLLMLVIPEGLQIIGGEKYAKALPVLMPVICGGFFQYIYSIYGGIEQLEKKGAGLALATIFAAILNVILNAFALPIFGYVAAAYTTLVCYGVLAIVHFLIVKKLKLNKMYENKFILCAGVIVLILGVICTFLFKYQILRFLMVFFILVISSITILIFIRKKRLKGFS